jgi:hypothetical protein
VAGHPEEPQLTAGAIDPPDHVVDVAPGGQEWPDVDQCDLVDRVRWGG